MIIYVDGNIGSGKSTILHELQKRGYDVFLEPIDVWRKIQVADKNLFQCFYDNPKRYTFIFQLYILLQFRKQLDKLNRFKIVFVERSFLAQCFVFAKYHRDNGNLSDEEFCVYSEFFEYFVPSTHAKYIYLNCSPSTCFSRIKARRRREEMQIDFDYINNIDTYYKNFLQYIVETKAIDQPVLQIDTEQSFDEGVTKILDYVL